MTQLLEEAIAKVRELPAERQDEAAGILLTMWAQQCEPIKLDEETRAAIQEGLAEIERGEVVSEEEMAELFRQWKT